MSLLDRGAANYHADTERGRKKDSGEAKEREGEKEIEKEKENKKQRDSERERHESVVGHDHPLERNMDRSPRMLLVH